MKLTKETINNVYKSKLVDQETLELKGYELIEELFVDSSGWGQEGEWALTQNQFMKQLNEILDHNKSVYSFLTRAGQFQVYVGLFKKTGKSKAKKIDNNTLEIKDENKRIIRLHSTNILEFDDNQVKLDSGGWETVTTKDRMNKYLPNDIKVFQKDYKWYVSYHGTGLDFKDGMVLDL